MNICDLPRGSSVEGKHCLMCGDMFSNRLLTEVKHLGGIVKEVVIKDGP